MVLYIYWIIFICSAVVSIPAENEKLRFLQLAFGRNTFTQSSDLIKLKSVGRSNIASTASIPVSAAGVHYFACSIHASATLSSEKLNEFFGYENTQTVFESKTDNTVCFVVVSSVESPSLPPSLVSLLQIWMALPVEAKLTTSLAARLLGGQQNHSKSYPLDLELTFGLGASAKGLLNLTMDMAIDSMVQSLRVTDLGMQSPIQNLFMASSLMRSLWFEAASDLDHMPSKKIYSTCRFNDLAFAAVSGTRVLLTISSPSNMTSPALDASCLSILVAVLVQTRGCLLISEVVKYKPLNDDVNRVVQTGSFTGDKIYHSIGLRGNDVVIGMAGNIVCHSCKSVKIKQFALM